MEIIDINKKIYWYIKFEEEKKKNRKKELKDKWCKSHDISDCGKWTQEDLAVILENQTLIHEIYNTNPQLDLVKKMLLNFAAPYLVHAETLLEPLELVLYYRKRENDHITWEREDICTCLSKFYLSEKININKLCGKEIYFKFDLILNPKFKQSENWTKTIVDILDFEVLSDITNNAKYKIMCKPNKIKEKLNKCISILEEKNIFGDNENWIVTSPKIALKLNTREKSKLTQNLDYCGNYNGTKVYSTKLIPEDRIILGFLSPSGIHSYCFKPYVLVGPTWNDGTLELKYAKKLFKEGSRNYATIKVEE